MEKGITAGTPILNADTLIKIIDQLPHVVYLKDSQHRFLLANQACLDLLNAGLEEVIGETDVPFYTHSYVEYIQEVEKTVLRSGEKKIVSSEKFIDAKGVPQIMKTVRMPFYIPEISEMGILGISINNALKETGTGMEETIRFQNEFLEKQKEISQKDPARSAMLYNEVKTDQQISRFLQEAIFPTEASVKRVLPDSFVMYRPKELTNGDFYWIQAKDGYVYLATIDCTEFEAGGTFIAMLCHDLLTQILKQKYKPSPSDILYELNDGLKDNLEQSIDLSRMTERLHINICVVDKENLYIEHSGSGIPMVIINKYNNQLLEPKNERYGLPFDEDLMEFTDNRIRVKKGDIFYLMTDGFSLQQIAMRKNKEGFGYSRVKDLLLEISDYTMEKQISLLEEIIIELKGNESQTDDIVVIGVKM